MGIQYIIIAVVITACIVYAIRRIYVDIRKAQDHCYGCAGCALHDAIVRQQGKKRGQPECFKKKSR